MTIVRCQNSYNGSADHCNSFPLGTNIKMVNPQTTQKNRKQNKYGTTFCRIRCVTHKNSFTVNLTAELLFTIICATQKKFLTLNIEFFVYSLCAIYNLNLFRNETMYYLGSILKLNMCGRLILIAA